MSASRSRVIPLFPDAPSRQWMDADYRPAPRRAARRRRSRLPLLALLLFTGGFLLGWTYAAPAQASPEPGAVQAPDSSQPEPAPPRQVPIRFAQPEPSPEPDAAQLPGSSLPEPDPPLQVPDNSLPQPEPAPPLQVPDSSAQPEPPAPPEDWQLLLVNRDHPLTQDFQVPELTQLKNNQSIDSRVYPALQEMMDAARAAGLQPLICSSFRSWETQERLFQNKVQRLMSEGQSPSEAETEAALWVALPGTSEHQAGLAVDIVDMSYQMLDKEQENTAVQRWLMAHCAEYGFILRYPTDKSDLTGISYEPWHYRYVGREAAAAIMEGGLCLEEYLAG